MSFSTLDKKGRLMIEKRLRERYGSEFEVVAVRDEIVLMPVPKNPLMALREEGRKLPKELTAGELKNKARDHAVQSALKNKPLAEITARQKVS